MARTTKKSTVQATKVLIMPIYNRQNHVLSVCMKCGRLNYVVPHCATAPCACTKSGEEVAHEPIPAKHTKFSRLIYIGPRRIRRRLRKRGTK